MNDDKIKSGKTFFVEFFSLHSFFFLISKRGGKVEETFNVHTIMRVAFLII